MKLGIMQPYFFPYIGYFQLINHVDKWVVFDDVQYINHGWINRNRILHPKEGWQYIIAPLKKHSQGQLIKNILLQCEEPWKEKILSQLSHYKKTAPFYKNTIELVEECLSIDTESITNLNINILKILCQYLDIKFDYIISSESNFDYTNVSDAGEWALRISEQMGAEQYINPLGGVYLFDKSKFQNSGIELLFLKSKDNLKYIQRTGKFESWLSIIDVLMFNSKDDAKRLLKEFEVIKG